MIARLPFRLAIYLRAVFHQCCRTHCSLLRSMAIIVKPQTYFSHWRTSKLRHCKSCTDTWHEDNTESRCFPLSFPWRTLPAALRVLCLLPWLFYRGLWSRCHHYSGVLSNEHTDKHSYYSHKKYLNRSSIPLTVLPNPAFVKQRTNKIHRTVSCCPFIPHNSNIQSNTRDLTPNSPSLDRGRQ